MKYVLSLATAALLTLAYTSTFAIAVVGPAGVTPTPIRPGAPLGTSHEQIMQWFALAHPTLSASVRRSSGTPLPAELVCSSIVRNSPRRAETPDAMLACDTHVRNWINCL